MKTLSLCYALLTLSAAGAAAQFTLTITVDNLVVSGPAVIVTASLANRSSLPILLQSGTQDADYNFTVTDSEGKTVPESAYARRVRQSVRVMAHALQLGPGRSVSTTIDIAKFVEIPSAGTYAVQLQTEPYLGAGSVTSNVITITVLSPYKTGPDRRPNDGGNEVPSSGPLKDSFGLHIEADRAAALQGREIPVYAFLKNTSAHEITIPSPNSWDSDYGVDVRDEKGAAKPETLARRERNKAAARIGGRTPQILTVPGSTFSGELDISQRVEMTAPGTYKIQLWWAVPQELGGGEIRSNVISIELLPFTGN